MRIFFHNSRVLNPFQRVYILEDKVSAHPLLPIFLPEYGKVIVHSIHRLKVHLFRVVHNGVISTVTLRFMGVDGDRCRLLHASVARVQIMLAWKSSIWQLGDMTCSIRVAVILAQYFSLQSHLETARLLRHLLMGLSGAEVMPSRVECRLHGPMFQEADKVIRIFAGFDLSEPGFRTGLVAVVLLVEEFSFALLVLSIE